MSTLHDAERLEIDETDEIGAGEGPLTLVAPPAAAGQRLDKALALLLPEISRSRLQQWIDDGAVRVDGGAARVRQLLSGGERIDIVAPPSPAQLAMRPEPIEIEVVYEDAHIAVLDKPPGLVVHPAAGNWSGTLANGLLARFPQTAGLPRAGIVHRLDADTSGLMVVALSLQAQTDLVRQLQARSVMREYWAIVAGVVPPAMTVDAALARDPRNPLRFAVSRAARAKPARTHLRCLQTVGSGRAALSWVACRLDTGRTHQIRVHLESIGHPLVGDPVYRRGRPGAAAAQEQPAPAWQDFRRQALHACRLGLVHPVLRTAMNWFRPPPADMRSLMRACGFAGGDAPIEAFG
ncbi:MAG: RluA family pseudouridine synthase [Burkholderiales bacterium]|nr:MAG: RluA family pseudouridine synthase [Burkholderiales bacterium]